MNKAELPEDVTLAGKVLDSEARKNEMGRIGHFFGSSDNAVVYLAATVIVVAVIGGSVLAYHDAALRPDFMKAIAALAISALGYMFGSSRRSG